MSSPSSSEPTLDDDPEDFALRLQQRMDQLTLFSQAITQRYTSLCFDFDRLSAVLKENGIDYDPPPGVGSPLPHPPDGVTFSILSHSEACVKIQSAYRGWRVRRRIEDESNRTVCQSAIRRRSILGQSVASPASHVEEALRAGSSGSELSMDTISKRDRIANEILSTEKVYLTSLKLLVKVFKVPLVYAANSSDPIIPMDDCTKIFSNVETIFKMHEDFYKELTARWDSWEENNSLGDVFLAFTPFLKLYTQYSRNYGDSLRLVKELRATEPKFKEFLEARSKIKSLNNLAIDALLIMPIQRIPRYKLLLQDFKKHTPDDHSDLTDLEKALVLMEEVAVVVDNAIVKHENLSLAANVQQSIQNCPPLIAPGRRYVREGPCTFPNSSTFLTKKGYLFLFNNLLIVTKVKVQLGSGDKEAKFALKAQMPLSTVQVVDVPSAKAPTFQVLGASATNTYDVSMATPELKHEWMNAISDAAKEMRRADKAAAMSRLEAKSSYGGEALLQAKEKINAMLAAVEEHPMGGKLDTSGSDESVPPPTLQRDRPPSTFPTHQQNGGLANSDEFRGSGAKELGGKNLQKSISSKMHKVLAKKGPAKIESKSMYIPDSKSEDVGGSMGGVEIVKSASDAAVRGARSMYHPSSSPTISWASSSSPNATTTSSWGSHRASTRARRGGRRGDFLSSRTSQTTQTMQFPIDGPLDASLPVDPEQST